MDLTYLILVIPALLISIWAQMRVEAAFSRYSAVTTVSGLSGKDAAERVLHHYGVYDVSIERIAGQLTDHFDPSTKTIRLSQSVYDSRSVAALGVAAHEAGHAAQHAEGYRPLKLRSSIVTVTNIGSRLSIPLFLLGMILSFPSLAYLGAALFGLSVVFQLITLPVEFNASRRAMAVLEDCRLLNEEELDGADKVLRAAAVTYLAALLTSLANFLRLLILAAGNDRRRR